MYGYIRFYTVLYGFIRFCTVICGFIRFYTVIFFIIKDYYVALASWLINFEEDLYDIIKNVEFKRVDNDFLDELKSDIRDINNSPKMFVPADKTRNVYETSKETYEKLLSDNITKAYKKVDDANYRTVNQEAKATATKLGIADRVHRMAEKPAFVTLKDHKENFDNSPKCRLLNPAKSELGKLSKQRTERLINGIKSNKRLSQWDDTGTVIELVPKSRQLREKIHRCYTG